jgi:hypothetical protein
MNASFDLIAAIGLTACAATVIGTLASEYAGNAQARRRIAVALGVWFLLVVVISAVGGFRGAPWRLGLALAVPAAAILWIVLADPARRQAVAAMSLPVLVGIHAVRALGILFVLLYAQGRLPAPFAPTAGWGDVFIGVTALPLAWAIHQQRPFWRELTLAWSLLGALDLVVAVALGVLSAPDSPLRVFENPPNGVEMISLPWILIPGFTVPLLFLCHVAVIARLRTAPRALPAE